MRRSACVFNAFSCDRFCTQVVFCGFCSVSLDSDSDQGNIKHLKSPFNIKVTSQEVLGFNLQGQIALGVWSLQALSD